MNNIKIILIMIGLFIIPIQSYALDSSSIAGKGEYENNLEVTLQKMVDAIAGNGQAVIAVNVDLAPSLKKISYTNQSDVEVKKNEAKVKGQYLMPGVPALKNINEAASSSLPFDYQEESTISEIKKINVNILFNSEISGSQMGNVRKFVENYLRTKSRSRSILIYKEKFNEKSGIDTAFGKFKDSNEAKSFLIDVAREVARDISNKSPDSKETSPIVSEVNSQVNSNSGLPGKNNLVIIGAISVGVLLLFIGLFLILIMAVLKNGKHGSETSSMTAGSFSNSAVGSGFGSTTSGETYAPAHSVEASVQDESEENHMKEKKFFAFINKNNVHKLKHLLQIKIALNEATPQTIAMTLACLSPDISAKILVEYPPKIQAEIVSILVSLEQYDEEAITNLEKEIASKISTLLGGKYTIRSLIDSLSTENKKIITKTIAQKYPSVLDDIRDYIVLFEDIIALDEMSIKKIFSELDSNTIATAICRLPKAQQDGIIRNTAKSTAAMIEQWVELKGNNISYMEIEEAQNKVINFSKKLESEGLIKIEKIDFLKADVT